MPDNVEWITLLQIPLVLGIVWYLSQPLSTYIARVAQNQPTPLDKALSPLAHLFYRWININPDFEHRWQTYALSALSLNIMGILFLMILQLTQGFFSELPNVGVLQALNTAVSFATNTNWQSYTPETSLANFVQTGGIAVQMFISAGTGLAIALALTRSFMDYTPTFKKSAINGKDPQPNGQKTLGNFWVDCTRMILWVLLPLSIILSLIFISLGLAQSAYEFIASQEAIKLLGTNGGGFFKANAAHPFENPNPLSNLVDIVSMLLIVFSLPRVFGKMVGHPAQGNALLKAMLILYILSLGFALCIQYQVVQSLGPTLEGMETRFGWVGTVFFNITSTTTGTGATTASLSSLSPLTGLTLLSNILSGGVIFGGIGSGFCHMLLYALLAVFIAGLMVGRTPEYLGKKIESFEMKMVVIAIMLPAFVVLGLTACAALYTPQTPLNAGPHGLTEILYAFASTSFNNGSSFAGLDSTLPFYQLTTMIAMSVGRFVVLSAILALAGNLAQKTKIPTTVATFPTTGTLFVLLLITVILISTLLIFFPIFSLGPLAEQVSQWHILPRP